MPQFAQLGHSASLRLTRTHTNTQTECAWRVFVCGNCCSFFKFIGSQVSREVRINGNVLQGAVAATASEKRSRFGSWQCVK